MSDDCPIQVAFPGLHGRWIDCTFPAGHEPWLHSWQTPGESPFVMAPSASEVRNRDGGPLGYPYDEARDAVARLAELENAVTWNTSCTSCATVLDSSIREHERAERAEEKLATAETAARADERERIARQCERMAEALLAERPRLTDKIMHPAMAEIYRHAAEIARGLTEVPGDG